MTIKESVVEVGAINMGGLGGAFSPVFLKGKMRIQHSKGSYSSKHVPIFDGGKYSIVVGALHAKKKGFIYVFDRIDTSKQSILKLRSISVIVFG